jgi:hypothetical protein
MSLPASGLLDLLSAIPQPLEVEEVGETSLLGQWGGPVVVALAAIIGASIAAAVSILNLRRQLDNDRRLRDREHIRDTLDSVAEHTQELNWELRSWRLDIEKAEQKRDALPPDAVREDLIAIDRQLLQREVDLNQKVQATHKGSIRLMMRLGQGEPVPIKHLELADALHKSFDALGKAQERNRTDEEKAAADDCLLTAQNKQIEFWSACEEWFTS